MGLYFCNDTLDVLRLRADFATWWGGWGETKQYSRANLFLFLNRSDNVAEITSNLCEVFVSSEPRYSITNHLKRNEKKRLTNLIL